MRKLLAFVGLASLAVSATAMTSQYGAWHGPLSGVTSTPPNSVVLGKFQKYALTSGGAHPIKGSLITYVGTGADKKLIFIWRVFNDKDSGVPITQLFLRAFPNGPYTIDYYKDQPGNVGPTFVSGSQGVSGDGYYTTFQFTKPIMPGQSSYMIFARTDATESTMALNAQAYVNGGQTNSSRVIIPAPVLPPYKP